jgi:hypothetical protein
MLEQLPEPQWGSVRPAAAQVQYVKDVLPGVLQDVEPDLQPICAFLCVAYADVFDISQSSVMRVPPLHIPVKTAVELAASRVKPRATWCKGYQCTPEERKFVQGELDTNVEAGKLRRRYQPSPYASPAFPVDGSSSAAPMGQGHRARTVVDFNFVNWMLSELKYPVRTFDDLVCLMAKSNLFSLYDMSGSYHQAAIDAESSTLTTISFNGQLYSPEVLWEGVMSAPGLFQGLMLELHQLQVLLEVLLIYLDDHLLHTSDDMQHIKEFEKYLQTCRHFNIKLKLPKCKFFRRIIEFLGRLITHGLILPPTSYLCNMRQLDRPRYKEELHRFLGCCAWVIRHLPGCSVTLHPLFALLHRSTKRDPLCWDAECAAAWERVLAMLEDPCSLAIPQLDREFAVVCDGSKRGWGALLMQRGGPAHEWRTVAVQARVWTTVREKRYGTARSLEIRALAAALREWSKWVRNGMPVYVMSDHEPLSAALVPQCHDTDNFKSILAFIASFPVSVSYLPGEYNPAADWLSREGLTLATEETEIVDWDGLLQDPSDEESVQ